MALVKNEIPILEYDTDRQAVLMPKNKLECRTPKKVALLFMEPEIETSIYLRRR